MAKKNESDNNSVFTKSIDVNRSALQNIFVYGCFDKKMLAEKCKCSEDKIKLSKKFYDTCLKNHIGSNYMIRPDKSKGAPAKASYLNYHRFGNNNNFLYSAYLWSSIAKIDLWRYTVIRQCILEADDICDKDKDNFYENLKILTNEKDEFRTYFNLCCERGYEHVLQFLESVWDNSDIRYLINGLCDALSVFGRKAPYMVPAYSIMRKLKKSYDYDISVSSADPEIWDFTYDNYDSILYDDAVYTIIQAIRNKNFIGYTKSVDSKDNYYIIPLKIMKEYSLGRTYLFYGKENSEAVSVIRLDNMFNVTEYGVKKEYRNKYDESIQKLNDALEKNSKYIWLSSDYTTKNVNRTIVLNGISSEAVSYISKYAPEYEYDPAEKKVKFTLRKADDIKPFIRILATCGFISKEDNPLLFEEFSVDVHEINNVYSGEIKYLKEESNNPSVPEKNKSRREKKTSGREELFQEPKSLHLFNKFNSYSNIMLEDIQLYLMNYFYKHSDADSVDIEPAIHDSFENCGFNVNLEFYGRMIGRFINDLREVQVSNNIYIVYKVFLRFEEVTDTSDQKIPKIPVSITEQELFEKIPAQIFTDYEYEYIWYMLQDNVARSLLPESAAKKMEEKLSSYFSGRTLDDVFITRFDNATADVNTNVLRKNIIPVSQAIHNKNKIKFIYKDKEVIGYPYRLTYSLRERVPRLIVKCNDEDWVRILNIEKMKNVEVLKESDISNEDFKNILDSRKKYIEIVIHKNEFTREKNVFERALRLFSSYEKYTWDDQKNNDYIIAVAYYNFDVDDKKRIYKMDTIVGDILSLGKYAEVLPESRYDLPEKQDCITYDTDMYNEIKRIYRKLDSMYNT